ncbi:unnamed protein product [Adineta steineri]|uniref:ADP-ribosylglycohydrolase n=1 Tax=Adineta steineri TaxID=433720 RepID=A0A814PDB4_9BILA|nr:unnamed protein product [Adineta steineri]
MHWLNPRYHDKDQKTIVKPNELEASLHDPPECTNDNLFNRVLGSMMGLTVGDALGAHVEFRPRQYLIEHPVTDLQGGGTWGLQQGQFTDDTSMALCLAISLIVCHDFQPYDQLVRYKWWYRNGYMSSTGQCFDIGAATRESLHKFEDRQHTLAKHYQLPLEDIDYLSDPRILKYLNVFCGKHDAAGNGGLMRLAPVPLFFWKYPNKAVEYCGQSAMLTHGDQKAVDACRFYGALIVAALQGKSKSELLHRDFYQKHREWFGVASLHEDVLKIVAGSYKKKNGYEDGIRGKGYVIDSLEAALWAFWSDEDSFENGVISAVNLGDDTDTTAAIYGQLAGAYYGYRKLPERWISKIYAGKFITCLSKWIVYESEEWPSRKQSTSMKYNPTSKV